MKTPRTLLDKVWDSHVVRAQTVSTPAILYVDLHLVHEVTSAQAFAELRKRGVRVRCPGNTVATMDHSTPTDFGTGSVRTLAVLAGLDEQGRTQLEQLQRNCTEFWPDDVHDSLSRVA